MVAAWGDNGFGQTNTPVGLSSVVAIAAGGYHNLALKNDGIVIAWGRNSDGQTNIPVGLSNVVAIAAGENHCLALKSDGTVIAWGYNGFGQSDIPVGLTNVAAIAEGRWHSLALKLDGTVIAWGRNAGGETNIPGDLNVSLPVAVTGTVDTNTPGSYLLTYTATNSFGGIATATRTVVVEDMLPPVINVLGANPLTHTLNVPFVDPGATALDDCAGSVAVTTNSTVNIAVPGTYAVSYTATDSFGNSAASIRSVQVIVPPIITLNGGATITNECHAAFTDSGATAIGAPLAIAAGWYHTLALKGDGTVAAWGDNSFGQTNITSGMSNVVAIAGGGAHNLAVKSDGMVVAWGYNADGQTNVPPGLSNVVAVAGGAYHSLALQRDGTIVAWGQNDYDQTNVPVGLSNVVAIAGGAFHSLALKSDGTVVAWGAGLTNEFNGGSSNVNYGQSIIPVGLSISLPVTASGSVDTNTPGSYMLTYTATNILGGSATTTRTVVVQDTLPPVITIIGANPLTNLLNDPFVDPGATALDACGGSLAVTTNSTVNITVPGNYFVSYTATDGYGNSATNTRVVQVIVPSPVITSQPTDVTLACGSGPASFSVTASGEAPLAYQWHLNGAMVPGATGSNHVVNPATPAHAGGYTVVITNAQGAVTSSVALLTLTNQTPTAISADAFSLSPGGTLVIAPSALMGNDSAGTCDGSSTALTFLSFSSASANGGTLQLLPPGTALWTNRYNGTGNFDDIGEAVAVDGSGNLIVAGKTYESGGSDDYTVIKYSGAGLPLWTNRYNGPTNGSDRAQALAVDAEGTVFVTGYSASGGGNGAFATLAYSSAGEPLWTNRYSAAAGGAQAVTLTSSGNVVVTGSGLGGYLTLAYSSGGAFLWARTYNSGGGLQEPKDIAADAGGNVFVTGWSGFVYDYATLGYAADGTPLWTNRYNGPGGSYDSAQAVAVDGGGNVFVTGHAFNGTSYDYGTIKYLNSGVPLWTNVYDGPTSDVDRADALAVDGAGNVFVTGYSGSGGADDFATVAYSTDGTPLWTNRYNGPANSYDAANAVALDGNGNVIVTGHSYGTGETYDYATVAYSGAGVPLWTNRYIGPVDGVDSASAVTVDSAGNVFITGNSAGVAGRDFTTICYSGSQLLYIPPTNFTGVDTFTYVMQDGYGLMHTGTVSVAVGVVANTISTEVLPGGEVQLGFYGTPGQPYALERTFNLGLDVWASQQTNTAAANGSLSFTNLPVGSANFWRVRSLP
jgi:alpha-tubulin suppressor-like RCC1 family protein